MDLSALAIGVSAVIGLAVGAGGCFLLHSHWLRRLAGRPGTGRTDVDLPAVAGILNVLPLASIVIDAESGAVLWASDQSASLGVVHGGRISAPEIAALVAQGQRAQVPVDCDITVRRPVHWLPDSRLDPDGDASGMRPVHGREQMDLHVRIVALRSSALLVLIEDLSGARRVDAIRRDFVANVSHELKTPVGALSLLSEAVLAAADEPDEVRHFADRMQDETARLTAVVRDLLDLSRLEDDQALLGAKPLSVDDLVAEAVDSTRMAAQAGQIEIFTGGEHGLRVFGIEAQLVTALRNLLANAVAYSPPRTRVAVGVRRAGEYVEVVVTDQGIGIPERERDRIFERFYRVDQARSRMTGGTGLGLSIVKHVCLNHGGDVSVWSVVGQGSSFTMRIPVLRGVAEPGVIDLAEVAD